jgi:hypothetical protein
MTEVLVHGVVAAADQRALSEPGLRWIEHGDLAALVATVDASGLRAARTLRLHWQVLDEVASTATVLPVRFGTVMADDAAVVRDLLEPRQAELAAVLAELAGKVQMTVKGDFDEERLMRDVVQASPAIARLRDRVRGVPEAAAYYDRIKLGQLIADDVERTRQRCSTQVIERLGPLAAAVSPERVSSINAAVNAAFLVDEGKTDAFKSAVAELEHEFAGELHLRCIGPLPPYSFSDMNPATNTGTWA